MEPGGFSGHLNPLAWVRAINCDSIIMTRFRSLRIPVSIRTSYSMANIKALVDSGATDNFIRPAFAKRMGLGLQPLDRPKKIWNIDNTENKAGSITHFTDLEVQTKGICRIMRFLVTDIGDEDLVLGYTWLATYKPQVNWTHATLHEEAMPVILRSIDPTDERVTIAGALMEREAEEIVSELEED